MKQQNDVFVVGQRSMRMATVCGMLLAGLVLMPAKGTQSAEPTGIREINTIEGPGDCYVGSNTFGNVLAVSGGKTLSSERGFVGHSKESTGNRVEISGRGSSWSCGDATIIGYRGGDNHLVIRQGGSLLSGWPVGGKKTSTSQWEHGWVGFWSEGNDVLVTDPGSVWSNKFLCIGEWGRDNSLVVSNGATVFSRQGWIGGDPNANGNQVTVTGPGSVWENQGDMSVGRYGLDCMLDIRDGGTVAAGNLAVGEFYQTMGQTVAIKSSKVRVDGGTLVVTNAAGNAVLSLGESPSQVILNDGTVTVDKIVVNPGMLAVYPQFGPNLLVFKGGSLCSKGTTVNNGRLFTVGDGQHTAGFQLLGGTHSFANGLCVSSNAVLSGHGVIAGNVKIEGSLAFGKGTSEVGGAVTNNGCIELQNGANVTFQNPVFNNGKIVSTKGVMNFKGGVTGPGSVTR